MDAPESARDLASGQRRNGMYSLLARPSFYNLLQGILGRHKCMTRYMSDYVAPRPAARLLDIGCGTGVLLDYIPESLQCEYVGFDINPDYIAHAQARHR